MSFCPLDLAVRNLLCSARSLDELSIDWDSINTNKINVDRFSAHQAKGQELKEP